MARDATARLYDVDEDTVRFKKLDQTKDYDQGVVTFRARRGRLIDLDKLHESIWATRLSGGTRSGLVELQVDAIGTVITVGDETILKVSGAPAEFVLIPHRREEAAGVLDELRKQANGTDRSVRVTGQIDDYQGRWPGVLKKRPMKPRRILVTAFQMHEQ